MISLNRTDSDERDFQQLSAALEEELRIRDGEDHVFLAGLNAIGRLGHAIVAYDKNSAVGCGAIQPLTEEAAEIKRMYVQPSQRQKGIASTVLNDLEQWAIALGYRKTMLETGKNQPEAIALYSRHGYRIIPNFGRYVDSDNSVCFEKNIGTGEGIDRAAQK
jgi:putative acetyltransferase